MEIHFNKSFKTIILACAAATALAAVCPADAKKVNRPPVNTTQDVDSTAFSKIDFMHQLQDVLRTGSLQEAIALFDTVPEEYVNDEELSVIKASIFVSANKFNEAKTVCNNILKTNKNNTDAMEILVYIAKRQNDTKTLDSYIKSLIAQDAYNTTANIALGESAFKSKNYKLSRTYYSKALVRDSKNEDALFGLGQSEYYLGAKDASMDEVAKSTFERLLSINPNNAEAYAYLGKLAAANNEYKIANDNISKAIEIDSTNYNYYLDRGMYQNYLGKVDGAAEAWTKAISIQPDYFLAYAYRGGLYDENGMIDEAISDYENVLRCNPNYYFAYENIAILQLHKGEWTKARELFMKCQEMDKSSNISYPLMVTYCYYMEKNKNAAKQYSDKVLRKLDRNSIEYAMLRVWHDEAGEAALPKKIAAIENSNTKGKMYFYLALFFDMFGGSDFAAENYTKVVEMNGAMFFEFRLAEWRLDVTKSFNKAD